MCYCFCLILCYTVLIILFFKQIVELMYSLYLLWCFSVPVTRKGQSHQSVRFDGTLLTGTCYGKYSQKSENAHQISTQSYLTCRTDPTSSGQYIVVGCCHATQQSDSQSQLAVGGWVEISPPIQHYVGLRASLVTQYQFCRKTWEQSEVNAVAPYRSLQI